MREIIAQDLPRITRDWKRKRILLYAHGGLVSEESAIQRVADYRTAMLEAEVYPLGFVWKTDYWTTLTNMLARRAQPPPHRRHPRFGEGLHARPSRRRARTDRPHADRQGVLERDEGERRARLGKNRRRGTAGGRGARAPGERSEDRAPRRRPQRRLDLHAPLVQLLATEGRVQGGLADGLPGQGLRIASTTLWAPACTTAVFKECYLPLLKAGRLGRFALFTLSDEAERDDHCARIYNKSLLYLVSHAFEAQPRIPLIRPEGAAILGMAKYVERHRPLTRLIAGGAVRWVTAPNTAPIGSPGSSACSAHGGFDDDQATVMSTLAFILEGTRRSGAAVKAASEMYKPRPGASRLKTLRVGLEQASR